MGLLDGNSGGMLGLLSPDDRLMAALSALSQAGAAMAQPGQSRGQALASGFGAMGPGMMQGMQGALMNNIMLGKVQNEAAQRKAQQDAILSLPEDQRGVASANPAEFFKTKIDRMMPKQAEVPFGAMGADGAPSLAGYLDYLQKKAGAEAGGRTVAERTAQNAVPLTTETPEYKARVAGATETAQQQAQMPFVGPRAAAAAAASSPYDIAKAWAIPRVLPPGAQVVAGGAPGGNPAQVIMTSPNPSPGSGEGKLQAGVGELQSNTIADWRKNAESAFVQMQNTGRMREALDSGLKTGQFAPVRQATVGALRDLGVGSDTLDRYFSAKDAKQFDSASKEIVSAIAKTLGPNPTDADRNFIEAIGPRLRDTPEAVRSLLDWMDKKNQLKVDLYQQGYAAHKGGKDPLEFEQDWWRKNADSGRTQKPDIEALLKKYAP
jgi:hypothetical protein